MSPVLNTGCWMCRLRHKKCDATLPLCGGCESLEITCYNGHGKPDWMDNGKRQHDMAQQVKGAVKRSAERRRGRRLIQSIAQGISNAEDDILSQLDQGPPSSIRSSAPFNASPSISSTGIKITANNLRADSAFRERPRVSPFPSISTAVSNEWSKVSNSPTHSILDEALTVEDGHDARLSFALLQSDAELSLVMTYLDYVFPVLFPFYRPPMLEGGRSWLLALLMKNKGLRHTIISLTSYFFSIILVIPSPAHQICTSMTWEELHKQTDLAIKMVQRDLQPVNRRGVHNDLQESAYLMESIVQLLGFEVIIALTENWQMHLDAAIVLFEQIFQYHSTNESPPNISAILAQMGHKSFVIISSNPPLWNADQAAFRFFSAVLLVDDLISSTSLEHPPRLREYHPHLLTDELNPDQEVPMQLEDFIGCQSWAMLLVGEIAALDAWKKDMKKGSTLSMAHLVHRAGVIQRGLYEGLARLDRPDSRQLRNPKPPVVIDVLAQYKLYDYKPRVPDACTSLTRIWAHSARTYLLIVVSGWQPANHEVRDNVGQTIELFRALYSPDWLRTLAWPFCVTGCLAEEGQEV